MRLAFLCTAILSLFSLNSNATRWYVDANNNNLVRNGTSWNQAVRHIRHLEDDLEDGDEIWFAQGTYEVEDDCPFTPGTCFVAPLHNHHKEVTIYGGFQGNETQLNQRDPEQFPSLILIDTFYGLAASADLTVDGFTFTGTSFSDQSSSGFLGTFFSEEYYVNIRNCKFIELDANILLVNNQYDDSDEIYIILENCYFYNCQINRISTSTTPFVLFDGCTFNNIENTDFEHYFFSFNELRNCEIINSNFSRLAFQSTFENCLISNNTIGLTENFNHGSRACEYRNTTIASNQIFKKFSQDIFSSSIFYSNIINTDQAVLEYSSSAYFSILQTTGDILNSISVSTFDPEFIDPTSGNYQLSPCSPAINTGIGTGYTPEDLAGNDRVVDGNVDMGCYEFQGDFPDRLYVDPNATGNGSGVNWTHAITDLHTALNSACPRTEVWVKEGVYKPNAGNPSDREARFIVPAGVKLYGGFDGSETSIAQRDYENNISLLSGAIGLPGNQDNSYHILELYGGQEQTLVDGFAIMYANANGTSNNSRGGGITTSFPNAKIQNCYIGFNEGTRGAGVYGSGSGSLIMENVRIENNTADQQGGGFYTSPIVGLIPHSEINRCTFIGNFASTGGAVYIDGESSIASSLFVLNEVVNEGGAIALGSAADIHLVNSTLVDNAIAIDFNSQGAYVRNNIFQDNVVDYTDNGSLNIGHNLSNNGSTSLGSNSLYGNADFVDQSAGDYGLANNSIALNSGSAIYSSPFISVNDLSGGSRIVGNEVDMGAFENQDGCLNDLDLCDFARLIDFEDDYGISLPLACSTSSDNLESGCSAPVSSIWVKLDIPITGTQLIVTTDDPSMDIQLDVYTGSCGSLEYHSCSNIVGTGGAENVVIYDNVPNSQVFVRISSLNPSEGNVTLFPLEFTCYIDDEITQGNYGACYNGPGGTAVYDQEIIVEYNFAPAGGFIVVEVPNGQDQFFEITQSPQSLVITGLPAGVNEISLNARFVASSYEGCYTQWSNSITPPCCQPDNDECQFAQPIQLDETVSLSTRCATFNNWLPSSCILYEGRDLWYTFTPITSTVQIDMITIQELSGPVNPRFTVFTGTCGDLVEVGCGNDQFEGFDESHVISGLTPGNTYILRASVYNQQEAVFDLTVSSNETTPCLGDFNGDGNVNSGDLTTLLSEYGCTGSCSADLNNDNVVNTSDLTAFLAEFGNVCF